MQTVEGTLTAKQLTSHDFGTRVTTPSGYTGTTHGPTEYGDGYVSVALDVRTGNHKMMDMLHAFPISQLTIIEKEATSDG